MLKKTIIAGFALLIAVFAFQPVEKAEAKVRVQIGVGGGYPGYYGDGYGYGYGYGYRPNYYYNQRRRYYYPRYRRAPNYRYAPRYRTRRISCKRAVRIVRRNGFRNVRVRDCRGKQYRFTGTKRGRWFSMRMRSRTGRIYRIRRM